MSTPTPKSFLSDDVSANADGRPWTRDELRSSVDEYLKMLESERAGQSYIKKAVYKKLAAQFNRTAKAFEYRMQNISYVLALMGRQWLPGLKPAKNVGSNGALIEQFINELEQRSTVPTVKFELDVRDALKKPQIAPPPGNASPEATRATVTQIRRDPSVKAWRKRTAPANAVAGLRRSKARTDYRIWKCIMSASWQSGALILCRTRWPYARTATANCITARAPGNWSNASTRDCRASCARSRRANRPRAHYLIAPPASAPRPPARSGSRPRDSRRRGATNRRPR